MSSCISSAACAQECTRAVAWPYLMTMAGVAERGAAVLVPRLGGLWRVALGLLALKAAGQLAVAAWPDGGWAALPAYRVLYLHLMLLGFVTVGLVAAARAVWGPKATRGRWALVVAVGLLLGSLVLLTPLWPSAWGGAWVVGAVAACALGPVLVLGRMATRGPAAARP